GSMAAARAVPLDAGSAYGKPNRVALRPVVLEHADAMHLAQRAGAENLRAAARPSAKLRRRKLRHVLDSRRESGGGRHTSRIDEWVDRTSAVRHPSPISDCQSAAVLV